MTLWSRASRNAGSGEPTRVLLILQSSTVGGMESHCTEVAAELTRRGALVLAAVPEAPIFEPLANTLTQRGATVERINTDARRGRLAQLLGIARLTHLARDFAPDVVHVHTGGATGGLAAVLVGRLATSAVVVMTEHDVPSPQPHLKQRINRRLIDRSLHVLIAISRHNANLRLRRLGAPLGKLAVVLNGAPLPEVAASIAAANRASIRSRLGIAPGITVIGSVVRLAPGKGLPTLLQAFAILQRRLDARLLLVGAGPLEDELRRLATELGIQEQVLMPGHQDDPGSFVDAMDVFALPVPVGSGSIALLEAMARARPPVITFGEDEEPVVPEKTGLWSPPEDPTALAAALFRLSSDADLRGRLGRAAADHVHRHYSISRLVDDLIDVYAAGRRSSIPAGLRVTDPTDRHPGARRGQTAAAAGQA